MPSGARKRKANRRKGKRGNSHDHVDFHGHANASSSHPHGIKDPIDNREDDTAEGEAGSHEKLVDHQQEGDFAKHDEVLEEEIRSSSTDVAMKTPDVVLTSEECVPGNDVVEDKEVAVVEEDKPVHVVEYVPEKEVVVDGSDPVGDLHKLVEERIRDDGLVKEVVTLAQEVIPGAESSVIADAVNSELKNNENTTLEALDDKETIHSTLEDHQLEKIEPQLGSVDQDMFLGPSIVNTCSAVDAAKPVESDKQLEEHVVSQVAGNVNNRETHMQSCDDESDTIPKSSHEGYNGKEWELQEQIEKQPLIASNRIPVRRTSWMCCCGLSEVFSGANR